MRIVATNGPLRVAATDDHAINTRYEISGLAAGDGLTVQRIRFQERPIAEGPDGITDEALIEILIDRATSRIRFGEGELARPLLIRFADELQHAANLLRIDASRS